MCTHNTNINEIFRMKNTTTFQWENAVKRELEKVMKILSAEKST